MTTASEGVRTLEPGYFALCMATGITSTVLYRIGHRHLSAALLIIDIVCFAVLCVLYAARAIRFRRDLLSDLANPARAFAFFTFVAACNVLGVRLGLDGHRDWTLALASASVIAWLGLSYGLPARLILGPHPQPTLAAVNGTWFLWIVGTQSIAIAAALLEHGEHGDTARAAALVATLMWSAGIVLYLIVATLVLARLLLLQPRPGDLGPPYWITMGATAITVLASAHLLDMEPTPITAATREVVSGFGVVLWAFGTWLVPLLVGISVWRIGLNRSLDYAPTLWSVVFPLGMYATASLELSTSAGLPLLHDIGHVAAWIAFAVWALVFAAMLSTLSRAVVVRSPAQAL